MRLNFFYNFSHRVTGLTCDTQISRLLFHAGEHVSRCQSVDPSFRYNHIHRKFHSLQILCLWGESTMSWGRIDHTAWGEANHPNWYGANMQWANSPDTRSIFHYSIYCMYVFMLPTDLANDDKPRAGASHLGLGLCREGLVTCNHWH
jgi:hypothetical protein